MDHRTSRENTIVVYRLQDLECRRERAAADDVDSIGGKRSKKELTAEEIPSTSGLNHSGISTKENEDESSSISQSNEIISVTSQTSQITLSSEKSSEEFSSPQSFEEQILNASKVPLKVELPAFSKVRDRYCIADRPAAALASAVLDDVGKVIPGNLHVVIDRSKVRRERQKTREALTNAEITANRRPIALYFDGLYFDGNAR